jgi:hypothetical protein
MTSASDQPRFYLGCAVWAHPSWSGVLFPRNARSADYLRLYSRRLTTVEGNTTLLRHAVCRNGTAMGGRNTAIVPVLLQTPRAMSVTRDH